MKGHEDSTQNAGRRDLAPSSAKAAGPGRARVRPATPADIDDLIDFTRKVVPGTRWAADGIDADKFRRDGSGALKLLTAFRRWAENRDANELAISITRDDRAKATGAMLARMGFWWVGGNYVFDLDKPEQRGENTGDGQ